MSITKYLVCCNTS